MTAMGSLERLEEDHRNFARLLDRMSGLLARIRDGSNTDFELLRDMLRYMTRYPDLVHHPAEDELTARLGRARPALRRASADLAAEHRDLAAMSQAFLDAVERVVDGGLVLRDDLLATGARYVDAQRLHMHWEEARLFPRIRDALGEIDREAGALDLSSRADPLFGPVLAEEYRRLWEHIERELREG